MINIGDIVAWRSQSNGIWKDKIGKVIATYFDIKGRKRYVVQVWQDNGVPKYYEPWPSQLTKVFR